MARLRSSKLEKLLPFRKPACLCQDTQPGAVLHSCDKNTGEAEAGGLTLGNSELQASLNYRARPCLRKLKTLKEKRKVQTPAWAELMVEPSGDSSSPAPISKLEITTKSATDHIQRQTGNRPGHQGEGCRLPQESNPHVQWQRQITGNE